MDQATRDRLEARRARLLRKQFYIITMRAKPMADPGAELAPLLNEHLDFIDDLETRGVLFGAGPFRHEDGKWDGSGMAIVRAASIDAARAIAEAEPFHRAGLRTNTVAGWQLNEGSIGVRLRLSAHRFEID